MKIQFAPSVGVFSLGVASGFFVLHYIWLNVLLSWASRANTRKKQIASPSSDLRDEGLAPVTVLHSFLSVPPNEGANRLTSITHAILAVMISGWTMCLQSQSFGAPLTATQTVGLVFSLGYFLYDVVYELASFKSAAMVLHHIMACVGIGCGLLTKKSGTELLASIFATEISTPFYHLRVFFRRRRTPVEIKHYNTATLLFSVIFLLSRCFLLGPYITINTLRSSTSPIFVKISGSTVYLLSLMWGYQIAKRCFTKLTRDIHSYKKVEDPLLQSS